MQRRGEVWREVERCCGVDLRLAERLDDTDQGDECRVLLQADEVVEQRWDHAAHRLGHDHVAQRLPVRETERACGGVLARVHGLDPRAVDLRHVGRVDEDQRHCSPDHLRRHAPEQLGLGHIGESQRGDAEAEQVDEQDRGNAAEDVGVDDRQQAQREEDGAGKAADHGQPESREEDHDLRDAEDLHVREEGGRDAGQRLPEDLPVEERLLDLVPAGRRDDGDDEDGEEDDRRREGDRDRAPAGAAARQAADDLRAAVFAQGAVTSGSVRCPQAISTRTASVFRQHASPPAPC